MTEIISIPLFGDNCYVLRDRGVVMIDCGMAGAFNDFLKGLKNASIKPAEVKLTVVTHAHWDHTGLAGDIRKITGAPLALHRNEKDWLECGQVSVPAGACLWGKCLRMPMVLFRNWIRTARTTVDIVIEDDGFSLEPYGIPGKVIYTPGHSPGSVSIVLDSGEAFVGDMAMNYFPFTVRPGLPVFADDCGMLKESWKHLLSLGITKIYPAHGKPFSAEVMRRLILSPP
ncbi:MAG: MBL fold metallo-hydrolase [Vulcanimicrobiota bacterium]